MADYQLVSKGPLKLKGVQETGIKKKKKKRDKKTLEQVTNATEPEEVETEQPTVIRKTKAQAAFEKMQEKRQMQKIVEKASKTHKQRVEEFNRHLDSLTEHYDIPKVSWTK